MNPSISILLATYNGARYLQPLLNSLIEQTRPAKEIVICDDVSQDSTPDILRAFAQSSPIPVKLILNEKNKGYQRNFFDGISHCTGDYVAFCDQDDVWYKDKLETLASVISEDLTPSLIFSDCDLVDAELNDMGQTGFEYSGLTPEDRERIQRGDLLDLLLQRPCVTGMTMLCHRERLQANIPDVRTIPHDYLISMAFAVGADYHCIDRPLVHYRQHGANVIGMGANKPRNKRRPSIGSADYPASVNRDLNDKHLLSNYVLGMKHAQTSNLHEHLAKVRNLKDLVAYRLGRRRYWTMLFSPTPRQFKSQAREFGSFNIWMKDFRSLIRLAVHRLLSSRN